MLCCAVLCYGVTFVGSALGSVKLEVEDGEREEAMVQELQRFIATPDSYFLEIVAALKEHSKCVPLCMPRSRVTIATGFRRPRNVLCVRCQCPHPLNPVGPPSHPCQTWPFPTPLHQP